MYHRGYVSAAAPYVCTALWGDSAIERVTIPGGSFLPRPHLYYGDPSAIRFQENGASSRTSHFTESYLESAPFNSGWRHDGRLSPHSRPIIAPVAVIFPARPVDTPKPKPPRYFAYPESPCVGRDSPRVRPSVSLYPPTGGFRRVVGNPGGHRRQTGAVARFDNGPPGRVAAWWESGHRRTRRRYRGGKLNRQLEAAYAGVRSRNFGAPRCGRAHASARVARLRAMGSWSSRELGGVDAM